MHSKSELLRTLEERGYLYQCTNLDALDELLLSRKITAYIGFDCTAPSLHVGSLIQIMMLRIMQKCGHQPIVLLGGGTTKIGDPSGRKDARLILTDDTILNNQKSIAKIFDKFLDFDNNAILVDNAAWLLNLHYLEFLSDYGRHFTINRMLTFDSVKSRLEKQDPLTFLEFSYMLLQAYDFLELSRRHGCLLQLGGSDQWGNIVNGIDLIRKVSNLEAFGLTSPLLTTSSGSKMGKTASGAVWLNPESLSSYDYWQFWRNTEDTDVIRFLKLFTELPLKEIEKLSKLQGAELNEAKIILANEATTLCHSSEAAEAAMRTAESTFGELGAGTELEQIIVDESVLIAGIPVFKILCDAGLCSSKGDAKRLIAGKGAKVNNKVIDSESEIISTQHLEHGQIKLSAGKKNHVLIKVV